jgi:hypothetical protein
MSSLTRPDRERIDRHAGGVYAAVVVAPAPEPDLDGETLGRIAAAAERAFRTGMAAEPSIDGPPA